MVISPAIVRALLAVALGIALGAASAQAAPPVATKAPTVSGEVQVGERLTMSRGAFRPRAVRYRYRWEQAPAAKGPWRPIARASTSRYAITASVSGQLLRACVKGAARTGPFSARWRCSRPTKMVPPSVGAAPTARGALTSGARLAGVRGTWRAAESYFVLWEVSTNGTVWVAGKGTGVATLSYALAPADLGKKVRLRVITRNKGGSSVPAYSAVLSPARPTAAAGQDVIGVDGAMRRAGTGTWSGHALRHTYQWQAAPAPSGPWTTARGSGANAAAYSPSPGDAYLRVIITAENAAGKSTMTSAVHSLVPDPTPPPTPTPTPTPEPPPPSEPAPNVVQAPLVSGTATVRQVLSSTLGEWSGTYTSRTGSWLRCVVDACVSTGVTGQAYTLGNVDAGATLRYAVTAVGPGGSTTATSLPTAAVAPAVPEVITAPTASGDLRQGATLTASAGTWSGPAEQVTYSWQYRVSDEEWPNLGTSSTYQPGEAQINQTLRLVVTATNASGSTEVIVPIAGVVQAANPVNVTLPAITGSPVQGATLTADTGTWSGTTPDGYTYEWLRCTDDTALAACASTGGAASAYAISTLDFGAYLRVRVTATRAPGGETVVVSAPTARATPTPPAYMSGASFDVSPRRDEPITATSGTWNSAVPLNYAWRWQELHPENGWQNVPLTIGNGAASATFTPGADQVGRPLRVQITAFNEYDGSTTYTSDPTSAVSSTLGYSVAPSIGASAEPLAVDDVVSVTDGTWVGSPAPGSFAYQWQVYDNGAWVNVTGEGPSYGTLQTFTITAAERGKSVRAQVTADNGAEAVTAASNAREVWFAPENTATPALSGDPAVGASITAGTGTWEGYPAISYAYAWEVRTPEGAWTPVTEDPSDQADNAYVPTGTQGGAYLRVTITATNLAGSTSVTIPAEGSEPRIQAPPVSIDAPAINGTPLVGETLVAASGTWAGYPSPTVTRVWQRSDSGADGTWQVITRSLVQQTGEELAITEDERGAYIRIVETASNTVLGQPQSQERASEPVVVVAAPTNTAVPVITVDDNAAVEVGSTLRTTGGSWSGAPAPSLTYMWESSSTGAVDDPWSPIYVTDPSYPITKFVAGQFLRVTVTADNGVAPAASASSVATIRVPAYADTAPQACESPQVEGNCATLDIGNWYGTSGLTPQYQWHTATPAGDEWAYSPISGATDSTLTGISSALYGQRLAVQVSFIRGEVTTSRMSAPTAPVLPAPLGAPTALPAACDDATVGAPCVGTDAEWGTAQGTITRTYLWQVASATGDPEDDWTWENASGDGATSLAYTPSRADYGRRLRLAVTADNGTGPVTAISPATTLDVLPAAPATTVAPTVCASPVTGALCSATDGAWGDTQGDYTLDYQWQRATSAGAEDSTWEAGNIAGAEALSYEPLAGDLGYFLRLRVTAEGDGGITVAYSAPSAAVAGPSAPANTAVPTLTSGTTMFGANVDLASPGTWTGGPEPVLTTAWQFARPTHQLSASRDFACAVNGSGAHCWGYNVAGLGDDLAPADPAFTVSSAAAAIPVANSAGAIAVATDDVRACMVTSSGQVACWGPDLGLLGAGSTAQESIHYPKDPVVDASGPIADATAVAMGSRARCVLRATGQVACWGHGSAGQLGNGTTPEGISATAVTVTGITDAVAISVAPQSDAPAHACALREGGEVMCWGGNTYGQLGDGTTDARSTPVTMLDGGSPLTDVVDVAAGRGSTCVLLSDGVVQCLGFNDFGQLGDGTNATSTSWVTPIASGAIEIEAYDGAVCARMTTGAVMCWGANLFGALGNGSTGFSVNTPTAMSGIAGATGLSTGATLSVICVTRTTDMACAGSNTYGQLGTGSASVSEPTYFATAQTVALLGMAPVWSDIAGATDDPYVVDRARSGSQIRACVTGTNVAGSATACSAPR